MDVKACKTKMISLLNRFTKEKRERNEPPRYAAFNIDPWPYYNYLLLLRADVQHKPTSTNVVLANSDELMFVEIPPEAEVEENINIIQESSSPTIKQAERPPIKRRRKPDDLDVQFLFFLTQVSEMLAENPPPRDTHHTFFEMQMDQLSPDTCEDVKYEILSRLPRILFCHTYCLYFSRKSNVIWDALLVPAF